MFWVQELYKPAEANRVKMPSATPMQLFQVRFFCATATIWGGVAKKIIKAVKNILCQLLTTNQAIPSCTNQKKLLPVTGLYQ